jgi:dienelactone hydrolase
VITRYVGVGHGFDVPEAGDAAFASYATGTPLTYDASTAWQAWKDMVSFLKLDLKGGA